ncbi:hypothetical protein AMECASPLE_034737 [Ameca splendens]|uniref:Uncharacterized protein n=1 Tax=Ameca splendens TaxID=208324 RepID=A0ABV0Z5U8_9TELE
MTEELNNHRPSVQLTCLLYSLFKGDVSILSAKQQLVWVSVKTPVSCSAHPSIRPSESMGWVPVKDHLRSSVAATCPKRFTPDGHLIISASSDGTEEPEDHRVHLHF